MKQSTGFVSIPLHNLLSIAWPWAISGCSLDNQRYYKRNSLVQRQSDEIEASPQRRETAPRNIQSDFDALRRQKVQ